MKEPKTYNKAFKRRVIYEVLSGSITKEEARIRYGIGGNSTILFWIRKLAGVKMRSAGVDSLQMLKAMKSEESKEELKDKIKQLEAKLKYAELKAEPIRSWLK